MSHSRKLKNMKSHTTRLVCAVALGQLLLTGCSEEFRVDSGAAGNPPAAPASAASTEVSIPAAEVTGNIAGKPFHLDQATYGQGLELRQGEGVFADLGVTIFLFADDKPLPGSKWVVSGGKDFGNPHVHVQHRDNPDDMPSTKVVMEGYQLHLEFGATDDHGQLPGKIMLRINEEPRVELAGTFTVESPADPLQLPPAWHRPWVLAQVKLDDQQEHDISSGYVGKTEAGEWESNMAGTTVSAGAPFSVTSTTFHPRNSSVSWNEKFRIHGRHTRLSPGRYVFYVTEGDTYLAWQLVEVTPDAELQLEFAIDPAQSGSLTVKVPASDNYQTVRLMPLTADGAPLLELTGKYDHFNLSGMISPADIDNGQATFPRLAPGKYRVFLDDDSRDVTIEPGGNVNVTFGG